jgi:hypothetical protein
MNGAAAHVEHALGEQTRVLTPADKRGGLRLRRGGERVMQHIFDLVKIYKLDSEGLHSDKMMAHMQQLDDLSPLETLLAKLATRVADERFLAGTDAWQMALQFYALLQRLALTNRQVAESIAPLEAFFARRNKAVLATKPTKLQTRATRKLAHAERLVARARSRAGAVQAPIAHMGFAPPAAHAPALLAQPPLQVQAGTETANTDAASNGAPKV